MYIYVLTSNLYTHVVGGFAHLFNKYWGENQAVTIVGYEKRPLRLPYNFRFLSLGKQDDFTWSAGVLRLLDLIPEPQFILMLEDYYLKEPVNLLRVGGLWEFMRDTPMVGKIDLTDDRAKVAYELYNPTFSGDLILSAPDAGFQASTQAAIWRKDFLREYLRADESAWQFEKAGTKRMIADRAAGKPVPEILGCLNPPVKYVNAIGGEGHHPHIWALKRFPGYVNDQNPGWMVSELRAEGLME